MNVSSSEERGCGTNGCHHCWVRKNQMSRHQGTNQHCIVWYHSMWRSVKARNQLVKGRLEAWNLTTKLDLLKASHDVYTAYIYIYMYLI